MRLRVEGHNREEGRSGLENVVSREVLRGRSDRDRRAREDLQSDLGPATLERLEVDTAVDQCLREVATASLERVDTDGERSRRVRGGEELEGLNGGGGRASARARESVSIWRKRLATHLFDAEDLKELLSKERRVAVVLADIGKELVDDF